MKREERRREGATLKEKDCLAALKAAVKAVLFNSIKAVAIIEIPLYEKHHI
jgi:hypothetical protein